MSALQPGLQRRTLWLLLGLSFAHAMTDLHPGVLPVLLPYLREAHALSFFALSLLSTAQLAASSVTQPLFGFLSDRFRTRWFVPLGVLLSGSGLALVGWAPSYAVVVLGVCLSGTGVACFHPEGARLARALSPGDKGATAMGIFLFGGNAGYALGPLYGTAIVGLFGLAGVVWVAVPAVISAGLLLRIASRLQSLQPARRAGAVAPDPGPANWLGQSILLLTVVIRSSLMTGLLTWLPIYWVDVLGRVPAQAGPLLTVYMAAGAAGTLLGSRLADRLGMRRYMILAFGLLFPLHLAMALLPGSWALYALLFAAGFVLVSTFAVSLVLSQEYLPRYPAMASGLNIGLNLGGGALFNVAFGLSADQVGLGPLFWVLAILPLAGLASSLLLPRPRSAAESATVA